MKFFAGIRGGWNGKAQAGGILLRHWKLDPLLMQIRYSTPQARITMCMHIFVSGSRFIIRP